MERYEDRIVLVSRGRLGRCLINIVHVTASITVLPSRTGSAAEVAQGRLGNLKPVMGMRFH